MQTPTAIQEQSIAAVRQQLDSAAIIGGLRSGQLRRTYVERIDILMCRLKAHLRGGRPQAAQACRRSVERLLDEMEAL